MNVKHYLDIYTVRKNMQSKGITNPKREIIELTNKIVEKLSKMPPDEEIELSKKDKKYVMEDSSGNIIITFPEQQV